MKLRSFLSATVFFMVLLTAVAASAQGSVVNPTPCPSPSPTPTPSPSPTPNPVDVVYTGRLFGYFRVPSLQSFNDKTGCPDDADKLSSEAAQKFLAVRDKQDKNQTILVGTGDNFAPELEARVFDDPPQAPPPVPAGTYKVGNKELYFGSSDDWFSYKDESTNAKQNRDRITAGYGVIPNDNVACFLRRAKYAAIVPGKHDFYFGAERVREFARFLAAPGSGKYEPVQMLATNLVMKTEPIEATPVSAKVKDERKFDKWPADYPPLNLADGKSVYPWFSVVKIQLADIAREATFLPDLKTLADAAGLIKKQPLVDFIKCRSTALDRELQAAIQRAIAKQQNPDTDPDVMRFRADIKRLAALQSNLDATTKTPNPIKICDSTGAPNDLPDALGKCKDTAFDPRPPYAGQEPRIRMDNNRVVLDVYLPQKFQGRNGHFTTLMYGKNFGLCTTVTPTPKYPTGMGCIRFSSHTPFFNFPHEVAYDEQDGYTDPEPYVVKNNVAIFGVVDPVLSEQVGILNFGWRQKDSAELTTRLSVEDPAEALQQQLDYFNVMHPDFAGMKVLLAQMTPQHAQALAARFTDFQIVVSAADQDLGTSNTDLSTTWKPGQHAAGTFLAVPTPYYDPAVRNGSVHIGIINANPSNQEWVLSAKAQPGTLINEQEDKDPSFWSDIKKLPGCLPDGFNPDPNVTYDNQTYLKWLVLCTMQQHLGSDVAMIQTRDLFDKIPLLGPNKNERLDRAKGPNDYSQNVQQTLDRLIWKGDLITLLYVPGKALKKALAQSDKYEAEETATLLLSVDRGRKLETLGIRKDSKGEYFINGLPVDDDHLYAVATTDYIGAGDTGYPDLKDAARNPRTHPAAFTGDLETISSLVCRKLYPAQAGQYCLDKVDSDHYLDETRAQQIPPYPAEGQISKLWTASGLALPDQRSPTKDPAVALENRVERRSFWGFSLKNFSIGFKDLDNNRTDKSLKEKFAGITTSQVNSTASRTISVGLDTRLSYFADHYEFFLAPGIDYERQSQGDPVVATGISFNKNKLYGDTGMVWWRRPGRALPNTGAVFSVHGETQLEAPFSAFKLNTDAAEQIRITQKRGLLVLGRLGFRWQNRTNTFEIGGEAGREFRALSGYHFENPGDNDFDCSVGSAQTLSACINANSKQPGGRIVATSIPTAVLQGRPRAGMYWSHSFSFPLGSKLKYEVTQDADLFFVKFHRDTSIDTRFRYNSKNRLSFQIWPNFSIGPALDLFVYENKRNRNFLFQRTLGIETKLNFDIFNRREKGAQVIAK